VPADCQQNDDLGASIGLENDDDLFLWNVTFEGPENTLYEVSDARPVPVAEHTLVTSE